MLSLMFSLSLMLVMIISIVVGGINVIPSQIWVLVQHNNFADRDFCF